MAVEPASGGRPYLGPGASPAAITESLLPEDRERFGQAYGEARRRGDAEAERAALERWRGIAILQSDPERYAATVRRLAERKSSRPVLLDEPLSVSRRTAGL